MRLPGLSKRSALVLGGLIALPLVVGVYYVTLPERPASWWKEWTPPPSEEANVAALKLVSSYNGSAHCNWTDVTFLEILAIQFLRDPAGKIHTQPPPDRFTTLSSPPADALFTGWHSDGQELWLTEARDYAFLGSGDAWEGWPRLPYTVGCD